MTVGEKAQRPCDNCPEPDWDGKEWYRYLAASFDVKKARAIVADGRESYLVPPETLRSMGLPLDPPKDEWHTDESGRRFKTIHCGIGINEEHLAHIPEDKMSEPVIVLPFRIWSQRQKNDATAHVMIDGSHRAVRRYRAGQEIRAYVLSEAEAIAVCTNRESNWWKAKRRARAKTEGQ